MKALKKIRYRKMLAQEGRCYYCGLPMWDEANGYSLLAAGRKGKRPRALQCTVEHLLPRSEGGANTAENIVAACLFCNNARHQRKQPPSPEMYRMYVQRRMAAGRWLAAYLPGTRQGGISLETATRQA